MMDCVSASTFSGGGGVARGWGAGREVEAGIGQEVGVTNELRLGIRNSFRLSGLGN